MRLPIIIAAVICSVLFAPPADAHVVKRKKIVSSKQSGLVIRVEGGGWGDAPRQEIESVLYAVADELLTYVPKRVADPIVVTYDGHGPVALYEKGPKGEYLVHLSARNRHWPQFAYQFAHELCHILSNYEENIGADTTKYNQWFEEALCEAASLYALRSMAATVEASASDPKQRLNASALRDYAQELIDEAHRQLPANTSLGAWLRQNEDRIRNDPYLREKNEVIANLLLPLFEQNPENWDSLRNLNLHPADARNSLKQYLHNWYANAPQEHRQFIANVLGLLRIEYAEAIQLADQSADGEPAKTSTPTAAGSQAGPAGPGATEKQ